MAYTHPDKKITSPLVAIREMCIDCQGGMKAWVAECTDKQCALYDFRLGKNPFRKPKEYTDEEKKVLQERAKVARESRNS